MILPNRPILLITLPSLALLLGFVWLRRKKSVDFDTGGKSEKTSNNCKETATTTNSTADQISSTTSFNYLNHSESLPITQSNNLNQNQLNSQPKGQNSGSNSGASSANSSFGENKLGKSAPIDIAPNPRSPPKRITEQQIDHEIFKLKLQESDYKNLKSIEEFEDFEAESTPADSPLYRNKFNFALQQEPIVKPVIIKATMAAKISPENSFAESKYTSVESGDEQRDSANPSPVANGGVNETPKEEEEAQSNGTDKKVEDTTTVNAVTAPTEIIVDENQSPTRNPPPIASPPLSLCSLHSGDSGKGSSPPNSVGAPSITYDFLIPINLIGILIGRKGQFVNNIKAKTGANVIVKKNTHSKKSKICTIEGTQVEIDAALKMIRTKLPEKKYPHLSLERIAAPESTLIPSFDASVLHLHLIEGINNDVTISTIISGGHIFLQQPLHPSFPSLNMLQQYMNQTYSMTEAPHLPLSNVIEDAICVVSVQNNWYRVQIVSHNPQTQTCLVKYLDFGGYISVLASELRQIRTDFMTVPFQAMECLLSNIRPKGDEWSKEAADTLFSLTNGVILQAQVVDYSSDNLPEVFLFRAIAKDNVIFINQELVARGLAEWVEKEQEAES